MCWAKGPKRSDEQKRRCGGTDQGRTGKQKKTAELGRAESRRTEQGRKEREKYRTAGQGKAEQGRADKGMKGKGQSRIEDTVEGCTEQSRSERKEKEMR